MIKPLALCLALLAPAFPAQAGPWLREKGSSFTAVSFSATYFLETTSQTYLEYGLTAKTTLIADIGMTRPQFTPQSGQVTLSFRRALSAPDARMKWAYELGLGTAWLGEEILPHLRAGLSVGRGLEWGDKSGWVTVEAAAVWSVSAPLHVGKLDATLGMNFTDVTTAMVQIYSTHSAGKSVASVAPSLVFKPAWSKFQFQIGSESELGNLADSALKVGLWRTF